jgi:D-lyxose ketol-isomerase
MKRSEKLLIVEEGQITPCHFHQKKWKDIINRLINGQYHSFWGEPGNGRVLVGEVSKVNDDRTDNHFLDPVGRFPEIEEDEEPLYLLAMDYFPGKIE